MREWIADAVVSAAERINNSDLIQRAFINDGISTNLDGSQESMVTVKKQLWKVKN